MPPGAGRGYGPMSGGRGRGSFQGGYPGQMPFSPNNPQHRPSPNTRGSSSMGPGGYYGGRQGYPNSPNLAARSPAMMNANPTTPQMGQMQMANPGMQGQYGQFPPHMAQQVNRSSHSTPFPFSHNRGVRRGRGRGTHDTRHEPSRSLPAEAMFASQNLPPIPDLSPATGNFERVRASLTSNNQGYGMPPQFDPNNMFYNGQYMPQMQMGYMPPQSPRPQYGVPQGPQGPYMQQQYNGQSAHHQSQSMSRTSSQMSATDRPSSSLGQPPTPSVASVSTQPQTGGRNTNSPAPKSSAFTLPAKKTSAIVIKDPNSGAIKTFEKPPASPARASPSPVKAATPPVSTPPPRAASTAEPTVVRPETSSSKTDEEKKNEMRDAVARKLAEDAAASKKEAEQSDATIGSAAANAGETASLGQKLSKRAKKNQRKQKQKLAAAAGHSVGRGLPPHLATSACATSKETISWPPFATA